MNMAEDERTKKIFSGTWSFNKSEKSSLQLKVRMVLPGGSKLEKDETNDMQTHL